MIVNSDRDEYQDHTEGAAAMVVMVIIVVTRYHDGDERGGC